MDSTHMRGVCEIFLTYTRRIHRKSTPTDPNFLQISMACGKIEQFIETIFPGMTTPLSAALRPKQPQQAPEDDMSAEDRRELHKIYAAIGGFWVVILVVMSLIAWSFGAKFDFLYEDLGRLFGVLFGGGGGGAPAAQAPHGEL
jgi:farnesyl-diphosphate farnesyltransferase